jgi:HlyD family secretion protein
VVTYPVTIDVDMSALRGAHLLPGMTATVAIITAQRTGVLLIPASAFTFARAAANPTAGGFLARDQVRSATQQARQMLQQLAQQNPTIAQDNPFPAFVLERQGRQWIVKPVVLGLTDGTAYEVLAGLSQSERVVVGEQGGVVGTPGATSGRGGLGGLFGGRGGGAGGSGGGK